MYPRDKKREEEIPGALAQNRKWDVARDGDGEWEGLGRTENFPDRPEAL